MKITKALSWCAALSALLFISGCASPSAASVTKFKVRDDLRKITVEWTSPKDFSAKEIIIDPTNRVIHITDMKNRVDTTAVEAAQAARVADSAAFASAIKDMGELLKKGMDTWANKPATPTKP